MQLKVGDRAPSFSLPDADMETVDLASYLGKKRVVLFFYPKDGTPSCTREVTEFSDHDADFAQLDCVLIGINRDDCIKHQEFRDREGIAVALLSDVDASVCKQYGVWQSREVEGHRKFGIVRSTFVIDRAGIVRCALYNVNYKGHAREMLSLIKELDT